MPSTSIPALVVQYHVTARPTSLLHTDAIAQHTAQRSSRARSARLAGAVGHEVCADGVFVHCDGVRPWCASERNSPGRPFGKSSVRATLARAHSRVGPSCVYSQPCARVRVSMRSCPTRADGPSPASQQDVDSSSVSHEATGSSPQTHSSATRPPEGTHA